MSQQTVHLTREGVSIVLTPSSSGVPTIVHWGATLGDLTNPDLAALVALHRLGVPHSALDAPRQRRVFGENLLRLVSGAVLTRMGLRLPVLASESAVVLGVSARA